MSAIAATASRSPADSAIYVPYTLAGETVEVAAGAGSIPTAGACCRSSARARSGSRRSARILASAAAARSSIGSPSATAPGSAISWSRRWRRPNSTARCDPLVDAHGIGRRRITLHARMGTHDVLKVGFAAAGSHDIIPVDRCPILDPGLERRARCGVGAGRAVDRDRQAARHPDHGHRQRPRCRRARLRAAADGDDRNAVASRRTASAGAADAAWRTGADAHAADDHDRHGAGHPAAGLVPAGHRRRRGSAGGAGVGALQARQAHRRPVLRRRPVRAAAGGEIAGRRPSTATPARWRRCRRRRPRPPG